MNDTLKKVAQDLAVLLDQAETAVGRTLDTTMLKAHLAKMEAKDTRAELVDQLHKMRQSADKMRVEATREVDLVLQKVSDACIKLSLAIND